MKSHKKTIILWACLLLSPWLARLCAIYFEWRDYPMFILALVLLCLCILWKEKKPLQINYWLGIACVPAFLCYMFIPFSIGNDSFHYAVDGTNLFYNLPFAKQC